jgi:hypothetical protein
MKEVYKKLVDYTISKYRNLNTLSYAGIGDSRTEIRPEYWPISSWISRSYFYCLVEVIKKYTSTSECLTASRRVTIAIVT